MTGFWRSAVLFALVQAFAACAGGVFHEKGRTKTEISVAAAHVQEPRMATQSVTPAAANEKEKMALMGIVTFDVYRRGGRYHATAGTRDPGGEWIETDVMPLEPTVEGIAAACRRLEPLLRKALADAQRGERQPVEKEVWEQLGAKSERQFLRSTSSCAVHRLPDKIEIFYMVLRPDKGLLASAGPEPDATLPPDASHEDIARAVLDIFAKYPPPPGDKPTPPRRPRKTAAREQ